MKREADKITEKLRESEKTLKLLDPETLRIRSVERLLNDTLHLDLNV